MSRVTVEVCLLPSPIFPNGLAVPITLSFQVKEVIFTLRILVLICIKYFNAPVKPHDFDGISVPVSTVLVVYCKNLFGYIRYIRVEPRYPVHKNTLPVSSGMLV